MKEKRSYDLIFGIGEACSCTQSLRDSGLQIFSYPLDWLFGLNFEGRMNILLNDFIDKDDLKYSFYTPSIKCDAYTSTFKSYLQNYSLNITLDTTVKTILFKSKRAIKGLLRKIKRLPLQLLINLIPSKTTRKKLRKKYL